MFLTNDTLAVKKKQAQSKCFQFSKSTLLCYSYGPNFEAKVVRKKMVVKSLVKTSKYTAKFVIPKKLWNYMKVILRRKSFNGVVDSFEDVNYEGVWESDEWINLSKAKIKTLGQQGHKPQGYKDVIYRVVEEISKIDNCNILDFGGGTGFVYHSINSYFTNIEHIYWDIVDGEKLTSIGREYSSKNCRIRYFNDLPNTNKRYDVIYLNTTLQYIQNYKDVLLKLKKYNPKYFVFTRLLAGDIDTFITCQNIHGKKTPCMFLNIDELISFFDSKGYNLSYREPCVEESFTKEDFKSNIPKSQRIKNSVNIVFSRI